MASRTRRGAWARRSAIEWGVRVLLAGFIAVPAYYSITQTLAYTMRTRSLDRAHDLAPGDGRITALLAQRLTGTDAGAADRTRADRLARAALRQDPTTAIAASTLGLNAQIGGDAAAGRRLFAYAGRLSRREIQTQLWAIENAVQRGDVGEALRHYDIALRTSRTASDLLFPVLAAALGDPAIRIALMKRLAGDPAWGPSFILYASANADPRAAVGLFRILTRAGVVVTDEPRARVITALIERGSIAEAWRYYEIVRPGADRRMSRDPRFVADLAIPTPFDWTPVNDASVSTSIQRDATGGVFDFVAPVSVGGPLLRQLQLLSPGNYRLDGHGSGLDQAAAARPYWLLSCRDGRELGRIDMPNSAQRGGAFAGRFTVPAQCPVQLLTFVARPSDAQGGLSGQIDLARLSALR